VKILEKEIERKMCRLIKKHGGLSYKFASPGNPGVPDRIVILPRGRVFFVELKAEDGKPTDLQSWHIDRLCSVGANARLIRGWDAAKAFVDEVMGDG